MSRRGKVKLGEIKSISMWRYEYISKTENIVKKLSFIFVFSLFVVILMIMVCILLKSKIHCLKILEYLLGPIKKGFKPPWLGLFHHELLQQAAGHGGSRFMAQLRCYCNPSCFNRGLNFNTVVFI